MTATAADRRNRELTERLLAAFEGSIPRIWKSPLYLAALLIVAAIIVLLPLVYVGLIALTGYGLYYHAVNHASILSLPSHPHSRAEASLLMLRLVAYFGALFVGAILILFMVKPLFARPARSERRISFVRENEPVLFAFVEKLCAIVGAPAPRRIDVDCAINAAAFFRRGFLSFFGRDLVLQIGAPLVAGLSLREFAGVLAHEFGHFSQGTGMRLTYIIGRVDHWFARVVYQRDTWDVQLIALSQAGSWFSLVFLAARLMVWLTRRVLWLLMMVGHMVSCTMLRQMEYDADRHQVRLCGSEAFESAVRRLHGLMAAAQAAHSLVAECWQERRLPENLPALIASYADRMPPEVREQVDEEVSESRAGLLETHPADGTRIRQARRAKEPGVFQIDEPAAVLFVDFAALCREVTFAYYRDLIGPSVRREHLLATVEVDRRRQVLDATAEAARRYWTTLDFTVRPFRIDRFSNIFKLPARECMAKLQRARSALVASHGTIARAYKRLQDIDQLISDARQAECLLKAGFRIEPKEFGLKTADAMEAHQAGIRAERDRQAAEQTLARIEAVFALRLEAGLALLNCPEIAARLKNPDRMRAESERLLDVAAAFHRVEYLLTALRLNQNSLRAMEHALLRGHEENALVSQALRALGAQNRVLAELRSALKEVPYPFRHAAGELSISQYAIGIVPAANDLTGTADAVSQCLDRVFSLYVRVMGELAQIAEQVESAAGLPPIRLPEKAAAGAGPTSHRPNSPGCI